MSDVFIAFNRFVFYQAVLKSHVYTNFTPFLSILRNWQPMLFINNYLVCYHQNQVSLVSLQFVQCYIISVLCLILRLSCFMYVLVCIVLSSASARDVYNGINVMFLFDNQSIASIPVVELCYFSHFFIHFKTRVFVFVEQSG